MLSTSYLVLGTLIVSLIFLLHKYFARNFHYWEKRKVFYFEPSPFVGNFLDIALFRTTIGEYLAKLYQQTSTPFFGIFVYDKPHLIIKDPDLVKAVLVKDFNYFDDRNIVTPKHDPIISSALFINKNPEWKKLRAKLTPLFTSGKLKNMTPLINEVGLDMKKYIEQKIPHFSLDAKEICAKYSTDVIAKCAFSINAKCFQFEDAEFRKIGRSIFDFTWSNAFRQTSYFFMPGLVQLFRIYFVDPEALKFLKDSFLDAIQRRVKGTQKGNDLIDFIIGFKQNEDFCKEVDLEGDKAIAQAVQFFMAGFETTSSTMAFALYELCLHPHVQNKLHKEITSTLKRHGGCTYDAVQDMKYLHMVVCETLRKYPVLPFLDRVCKADYHLPGTDLVIEKGTPVFIPMFGLHYDEKYFPNPKKFYPERFSEQNFEKLTPFSYIPFGEGPRNCIGERFGLLGTKIGLIHILSEYEVERSHNTPVPLEFEPKSFVLGSKVGLPMKFRKINSMAA